MTKPVDPTKFLPVQRRAALRERDVRMLELAAAGRSQAEIGEQVGLSRSGVCRAMKRTEQAALAELTERIEAQKIELDYGYRHIYREAVRAWERSKKDVESVRMVEEQGNEGVKTRIEESSRGQTGDPRHLDVALRALERRSRLWGLDEIGKQSASASATTNIVSASMEVIISDEQSRQSLCDLAAGLARSLDQSGDAGQSGDDVIEGQVETSSSS